MRSRSIVILAVLLFAACSPYSTPTPQPTAIVPDHMVSLRPDRARPVPVTIHGDNLAAGVTVDLQTGEVKFTGQFSARLGDVSLSDVEPVIEDDALVIKASVPEDLESGSYHLFVAGPNGEGGTLPDAFEVRSIASVGLEANDDTPVAGARVTITANILDSAGDPVSAELASDIVFSLDTGSGLFGSSTLSSGSVRVDYDTADTPEGALVRATEQLSGLDVFGTLLVDSRAGDVAGVAIEPPNDQPTAGDSVELTATLIDRNLNLIPAALVSDITFEIAAGNGTLGQPIVDQEQIKITYTTHTTAETAVVRATEQVSGNQHTADSQIEGIAGNPARLHLAASPPNPLAGTATNVTAELQDQNGNPIPFTTAADVRFTKVEGRGILSASLLIGGQVLVPYATYRKVETSVIQGEVVSITGIPLAQVSIRTIGGDPVDVELVPESPTVGAGTQVQLSAYLLDVEGNRTSATAVSDATIIITAGPGTLDAPVLFTDADSVTTVRAAYNALDTLGQTIDFEATENVTGSANTAVASVSVVAGPVDHFDVGVGAPAYSAGSPFNITLTARDRFDNLADSFSSFTYVSDTTGTITPAISGDFLLGRRTETVIVAQTANNVAVHVEDVDGHSGDSAPFNVVGGGVDHFVIDPVAGQTAGTPFDVTIRAMDELGNLMDTYAGAVNIQDTTATAAPAVSGLFSGGVRVEPTTIFMQHPAVTLTVNDGLGHTGTSNTFAVSAGSPAAVVFISLPQNVLRNTPSAVIQVQIQDGHGNPSPVGVDTPLFLSCDSASCAFDTNPGGAFDGSVTSITIPAGGALGEFYFMDSFQGIVTMTVSDPGAVLSPASQNIRVSNVGQPSQVVFVSAPATVDAGAASQALTVELQDAAGTAIAAPGDRVVDLISSHSEGRFDTDSAGPFDGSITSVTILIGTTQATFYYRDTRAGPTDIDAAPPPNLVGDRASLDVLAGPVDHFEFDPIAAQQAGQPFGVRMAAYDAHDNLADSFAGTVTLTDLTGTASPVSSGLFSAGERIETMTVTMAFGADSLSADDGSGHTGVSNDFPVLSGGVNHFAVDLVPSPQNAGTPFQIHIEAQDAFNNIAVQFIGVVNIADTTGFISPVQSGPFNQGERDENVTVTRAAAGVFISVNDGAAGHWGWSNPFDVLHGPLDHFQVGPVPDQVGADRAFDVPMQARDAYDNVVSSFSGTVNLADLSGTLQPAVSGAFFGGLRTESVTIGFEMNDDRINADDGSGHTGFSNLFDVVTAQPVELTATIEFNPIAVIEGEGFALRLVVDNTGDYSAQAVAPIFIAYGGSGGATLLPGSPTPAQADIPARSRAVFVYQFKTGLSDSGWFDASAQVGGISEETGLPVQSNTAAGSIPITPASCVLNPVYVEAGDDQQIACNGNTSIGGSPTAWGGVPDHIFDWLPDFALSDNAASNPTADPDINTKYRVTVFDQLGCGAVDTATVTLQDGPSASFTASRQWACDRDWVYFDAGASTGLGPLQYDWDFGDGNQGNGETAWNEYRTQQWCPVVLTITDQNGCRATATMGVGARDNIGEPTGPVTFSAPIPVAPANGSATIAIVSDRIHECDGDFTGIDKEFHVVATRGRVTSPDRDGGAGIQVETDGQGVIHVTVQADLVGGSGRLLTTSNRNERDARGSIRYSFSGSQSLPQVVDFGPSGYSDLPPPRFAARFDKPMNPSTVTAAVRLVGDQSGPVPGSAHYDGGRRTLVFVPDALIDPANDKYTLSISDSATDVWGNQIDAAFEWVFGAVPDAIPPTVSCRGESDDTFSPDHDGDKDITEIRADLADVVRLKLWRVEIFSPDGLLVRTLTDMQNQNQDDIRLVWDGHDEDGLLVNNARYDYRITAVDSDGNVSASCTGSVAVLSVLDPAMFP